MSDWAPVLILLAAMRANTEKVIEAIELSEEELKQKFAELDQAIANEAEEIVQYVNQEIEKALKGSVPQAEVDALLAKIGAKVDEETTKVRDLVTLDAPTTPPPGGGTTPPPTGGTGQQPRPDHTLPGDLPKPTPYGKK